MYFKIRYFHLLGIPPFHFKRTKDTSLYTKIQNFRMQDGKQITSNFSYEPLHVVEKPPGPFISDRKAGLCYVPAKYCGFGTVLSFFWYHRKGNEQRRQGLKCFFLWHGMVLWYGGIVPQRILALSTEKVKRFEHDVIEYV